MPDKSGLDFMDIARQDENFANINVILLTADDTMDNVLKAEGKGISALHFLGKPFNVVDLQALVLSLSLQI
jgi:CheY-like chemotaxis protein